MSFAAGRFGHEAGTVLRMPPAFCGPYNETPLDLCHERLMSSIRIPLRLSICSGPTLSAVAGVLAGGVAWITIGLTGLFLLRTCWSAYAVAEPAKAYSFAMLLSRLTLASVCSIASGFLAVRTARENRKAAWWLGALLLLGSMPLHLPVSYVSVWAEYPAWYHAVYLLSLMPMAGFGGHLAQPVLSRARKEQ